MIQNKHTATEYDTLVNLSKYVKQEITKRKKSIFVFYSHCVK